MSADRSVEPIRDETWTLDTPEGQLGVRVRRPDTGDNHPVILMFHHGPGLDEGTLAAMDRFAGAGYFVVAPDRYYREGPWITFDAAELMTGGPDSDIMKRFFGLLSRTTDEMVARDVEAVFDRVAVEPSARSGKAGCVGYCVGARSVIRAMADRPDIAAGVMLHPGQCVDGTAQSPHLNVPSLDRDLYAAFGGADRLASVAQNQPLIEAIGQLGDKGHIEIHDGADHGFAVPGPGYHTQAAERSYSAALALFAAALH